MRNVKFYSVIVLVLIIVALTVTMALAQSASAANGNFVHDGNDLGWTNGTHVIAVDDRECDGNDAAVRYTLNGQTKVRVLRDTNGCSGSGLARTNPASYPGLDKMRVCEYIGKTQTIDHCTKWLDIF